MRYKDFIKKDNSELISKYENLELCLREYGEYREELEIIKYMRRGFKFVEVYNESDIYEINGKFVPYIGCNYYFKTLEDCKSRMDAKGLAYVSFSFK